MVKSTEKESELILGMTKKLQEENDHIHGVSESISQVAEVVQSNSATAEETAASSLELTKEANALKNKTAEFHLINE